MNTKQITNVAKELSNINGISFVGVNYTNQQNEKSQYLINVGVSYQKSKEKDFETLTNLDVSKIADFKGLDVDAQQELKEAKIALLKALIKPNKAQSQAQIDAYTHLFTGLKIHNNTNDLFVFGFKVKKTVEVKGEYKKTEFAYEGAKPLTRAKNFLKVQYFKSSKFRQFKITNEQAHKFSLSKQTIIFG